jgi:hypothetical protein
VDVPDAGSDLVGVAAGGKGRDGVGARAGGFDGEHVGVQGDDGGQDVGELPVTHVRVDLGGG